MIVPVVVSHAVGGWTGPCCSDELYACRPDLLGVADFVPRFTMLHLDLSRTRDDVLRSIGADPFAVATLWALRESRNGDAMLRQFEAYADVLRAMLERPHGRDEACQFLSYTLAASNGFTAQRLVDAVQRVVPEMEQLSMTIAEQLREEGRQQGIARGLEQGLEKGLEQGMSWDRNRQAQMLATLLTQRFGPLPARQYSGSSMPRPSSSKPSPTRS